MAANELLVLLSEEEKLKKQKAYEESVAKRHEERKAKMDKRKTKNEHKPEETQDYYWKEFNSQNSDIETLFEQICDSAEPTSLIKVSTNNMLRCITEETGYKNIIGSRRYVLITDIHFFRI